MEVVFKRAFHDLQEIGYIKGFSYDSENKRWKVDRYDANTLRICAIEKLRKLKKKEKEKLERLREKNTEKVRRKRQRLKNSEGNL